MKENTELLSEVGSLRESSEREKTPGNWVNTKNYGGLIVNS